MMMHANKGPSMRLYAEKGLSMKVRAADVRREVSQVGSCQHWGCPPQLCWVSSLCRWGTMCLQRHPVSSSLWKPELTGHLICPIVQVHLQRLHVMS